MENPEPQTELNTRTSRLRAVKARQRKLYSAWKAASDHACRLDGYHHGFSRELEDIAWRMKMELEE